MGILPRVSETGVVLNDGNGETCWCTVEITNLRAKSAFQSGGRVLGITYSNHVSPRFRRLSNEFGQLPRINESVCPQMFGSTLPTPCK